ncbi:hypothetical protein KY308_03600, partial [Candidatus Woesearchaeota archaeon]|nr:hypothetical protein [Candidatus Woesearchaeota archaeon]
NRVAKKTGSIVILDGSLDSKNKTESEYLLNLFSAAEKNESFLCAIAKTTAMTTAKGNSVTAALNSAAPKSRWCYIMKSAAFVKLHPNSKYIFRIDANKINSNLLSALAAISKDPVFLGYPYGLVEADSLARVSNREKEILRIEVASRFGKAWENIEFAENSLNAHEILDNIG